MTLQEYVRWGERKWGRRWLPLWLEMDHPSNSPQVIKGEEPADAFWFATNRTKLRAVATNDE